MNTAPQGPTMACITPAMEGSRSPARSGRSEDSVREQGDENEQAQDAEKPSTVATPTSLALPGVTRVHARALDADEDEDGDQHGVANLAEHAFHVGHRMRRREVQLEQIRPERGDRDDDEDRERHDLGRRGDGVQRRGLPHAAQDQEVHPPQEHRGAEDGDRRGAVAEHREERAQRRFDQDQAGDDARQHPIQ